MPNFTTPGVFIDELATPGPIAGVGTSTAAFIGPTRSGDVNVPTKITNWTQFRDTFGEFMTTPRGYLPYAVRGYFENGGTVAYIVRVGTAKRAFLELSDRASGSTPGKALLVRAKLAGAAGNDIKVKVAEAQIVDPAKKARVRKAEAPITSAVNDVVALTNAADADKFRPGDLITVGTGTERVPIARIRGNELTLQSSLAATSGAGTVRIADLAPGQKTFRIENVAGIESGSVVHLAQVMTGQQGTTTQEDVIVDAVSGELATLAVGVKGAYALTTAAPNVDVTTSEFTLVCTAQNKAETFPHLAMDPRHSRYFARIVDSAQVEVQLPDGPNVAPPPANRPAVTTNDLSLAGGAADNPLTPEDYRTALTALEKIDDVTLVCVPDRTDLSVQRDVITHCENMKDRFAILDSVPKAGLFDGGSVLQQRGGLRSDRGYAAVYYPWLVISDPASRSGTDTLLVPPSGHLAGIYARSDSARGVHKAPANEVINGALGLERVLSDTEQGELNIEGVNVLRVFASQGPPVVWGARTTAPKEETAWRYVNVRRLFLFIEESMKAGIRWAVFEPINDSLWKTLDRTITEFLTRVWSSGALFGATPDEAFYVKIDNENNPPSVSALGQIVIEVGIRPVYPAEFVIVRIGVWPGGSEVAEG